MTKRSRSSRRARANQLDTAAAAATTYPPWVLLHRSCTAVATGSSIADRNTQAAGHTTTGLPIAVSICVAPPPEGSRVCVQHPDGVQSTSDVVAAHGDSVLIKVSSLGRVTDHFIYNAFDAAAVTPRPPALLLLPVCYLDRDGTGLLRRGEDEFVVAELRIGYDNTTRMAAGELRLLRSGEWRATRPRVSHDGGEGKDFPSTWHNDTVIPVGDELLCWADMRHGLIFSKVFDESPGLRYVPLPKDPNFGQTVFRNVCVTAGGGTVKFVNIFPRCCCGGPSRSNCRLSEHAYTVHTWTLNMDDMTWVMDGILDSAYLWALDSYKDLPRVKLEYPVVSFDEPDVICFLVRGCNNHDKNSGSTVWTIAVDMRSKTLQSVFRYPNVLGSKSWQNIRPSRVSDYFNSKPSSLKPDSTQEQTVPSLANKSHAEIELQANDIRKSLQSPVESAGAPMQASKAAASPEATILTALEEIPGLDPDDMLKAYRILSYDDSGRRFRSLMRLPMSLRKDFVLLEIKGSEACFICSACSADQQL
uniref:DUF1618 domain-containing protein n=1 Tax=Setaria viridis TaxID=4556 RepID=A0A4U6TCB6_SETVI|nr:hypothetical protein SEVIR_8G061050v2 [Setaria viridis]